MANEEFKFFLNGGYKGIGRVRNNFPLELEKIEEYNKSYGNINWGQKLYNYVNNVPEQPKCKCGKPLKFYKFGRGYSIYCSLKCKGEDEELKSRIKNTFIMKYGVENPLQSLEIRKKREENFERKHGVKHQSQLSEVKEKRRKTNLMKYGVSTNLLCEDTIKKTNETIKGKYGVTHISQSPEIKKKKVDASLKKYGVEHVFQSQEFKRKNEKTTLKNYNVKHSSLSPEIRKKQIDSKKRKKLCEIATLLNIQLSDIIINDKDLTIKNYCDNHNNFNITQNLLHQRWYKYDKKICTKCYPVQKQTSGSEIEIKMFIESLGFNQINNQKILDNGYEIDIYIPENKLGIEYDGIYWHSNLYKRKSYHLDKTEECEKRGIKLLHVFENEWLFKKEIVKSIISSKLGICQHKIYARKCEIKEINDNKLIRDFLNNNHIQGFVGGSVKLGLFHDNELVSLMCFGKKRVALGHKKNDDKEYELLRFCNKINTHVIGGAGKLLNRFIKHYEFKSITTFADRRYSQGDLYKQLGFKYIGKTKPNYWYFEKNNLKQYHRFNFRKNVLISDGFNAEKTEHEIMLERDYLCIYDCGNLKFEYING